MSICRLLWERDACCAGGAVHDEVASGGDMVEMQMRRQLSADEDAEYARVDRVGAVSSKLAMAGDALLLPDLIQNIGDRPIDEVRCLRSAYLFVCLSPCATNRRVETESARDLRNNNQVEGWQCPQSFEWWGRTSAGCLSVRLRR